MESARDYCPGGFHPIHIGDTFQFGRYTIAGKLGRGKFSTVWLAHDSTTQAYVSLKVLAADTGTWSGNPHSTGQELEILLRLRDSTEEVGKECVVRILDYFTHTGPNGEHQCIVTELLGPNLSSDIEDLYPTEVFPAAISRAIIRQVTYGIRFLHKNGIVHGDLHTGNILFASPKLSALKQDDVARYSEVYKHKIEHGVNGIGEPPHVPQYLVSAPDPTPLLQLCLGNPADVRVKLCDFSEASIVTATTQPKSMNMPFIYRAPEVIIIKPLVPALSAEIWALAVLFYFILTGGWPMFEPAETAAESWLGRRSEDEVLRNIVLRLGRLPEPIWSAWGKRVEYFDEDGRPQADSTGDIRLVPFSDGIIDEEEHVVFEMMVRGMVVLDPLKRGKIDDVMTSEWFTKYCECEHQTELSLPRV